MGVRFRVQAEKAVEIVGDILEQFPPTCSDVFLIKLRVSSSKVRYHSEFPSRIFLSKAVNGGKSTCTVSHITESLALKYS